MNKFGKVFIPLLILFSLFFPYNSFAAAEGVNNVTNLDNALDAFKFNYEKPLGHFRLAQTDAAEIHNRQIIIKVSVDIQFDPTVYGVELMDEFVLPNGNEREPAHMYVVKVAKGDDYWGKLQQLQDDPGIIHAEADTVIETTALPEETYIQQQWYLNQMEMERAWDITKGSEDVTIAVLDTGVNANHPDLAGRMLEGYDFVSNVAGANDDNGHGTHIAGLIAANINNIGIAGVNHHAKILPVKVFCNRGTGSTANAIKGIYYAIDNDVDIINMSYVSSQKSELEKEALLSAYKKGIVLVASAGNDGESGLAYPASYPHVISVSATGKEDKRTTFSNYGLGIDIAAPGAEIFSTHFRGGYSTLSGTSFSAPLVSGIASLLKTIRPELKPNEIEWALEQGAEPIHFKNLEWNQLFGYGRVNAYETLVATIPNMEGKAGTKSSNAKKLKNDTKVKEKLQLPLATNWFTFDIPTKRKLKLELTQLADHLDLVAVLYRSDGGKAKQVAVIDEGSMGENESYVRTVEKGTYYLAIYDLYGRWSKDPYQVKFSTIIPEFPDVNAYKEEINYLVSKNIIQGFPDGTFKPRSHVTRLQAVYMVLRELKVDVHDEAYVALNPNYLDVPLGAEGFKEIAVATKLGFIQGKEDQTFNPHGKLTRGQMASILVKAYQLEGKYAGKFKDVSKKHWAYPYVYPLAANQIVTGYKDGNYRPDEHITREHFSLMMYRLMQSQGSDPRVTLK